MPWNLVEGMVAEPGGEWMIGEDLAKGLYDVKYGCNRCHMLGSTSPLASATATNTVPNPAATIAPEHHHAQRLVVRRRQDRRRLHQPTRPCRTPA